ncbi:MAG TPA: methylmalonyl-CoA mutase family protein [Bacteroidales bacterium]|nr:methylmalonyl-CoA mutase family protein [Bacteroidales bacterium]
MMEEKLFQEFPPISTQAWEEIIQKDLKGGDYDKKLIWKTLEGFPVRPYYRSENLNNLGYLKNNPGEFPYVRGVDYKGLKVIRQDIRVKDVKVANKQATGLISAGVTSLGFIFPQELNKEEFMKLMAGINIEKVEINFVADNMTTKYIDFLIEYAKTCSYSLKNIKGSNSFDPLAYMILHGKALCGNGQCHCAEEILTKYSDLLPEFSLISVNASNYHNAGGSAVQELAFALAEGAEYLSMLNGQNIDVVAPRIKFNFAVGSNYFMEIAKLRAARLLWAKIVEANDCKNIESTKINMHCETSQWNKTIYDPYVNMLRATTEAMAAIIGGTGSLTVIPFDDSFAEPSEFSLRIAKNVQLIIREEAHFGKVVDPAAGSYYIENLTDNLIEKAWDLFLKLDELGGFTEAVKTGFIQDSINQTAKLRNSNIATRREIVLGTNQYPNFNEVISNVKISEKSKPVGEQYKTISLYRGSEEFEKLRSATDKSGKRPKAFMLTIGNLNFRKARAQFSCNFFACAGFEVIDNNGFESIEDGMKEAAKRTADIIVLCSSDEEYEKFAIEAIEKAGQRILVIAGNPVCKPDLETKGVKNFIHVRSNVLEELKSYQKQLGIN